MNYSLQGVITYKFSAIKVINENAYKTWSGSHHLQV